MRVAIFTDNDFEKVNGVTTTLRAVLQHAPEGIQPRIYTAASRAAEGRDYLALRSLGVPIPFYGEMRMYVPRVAAYLRRAREARVDVIHLTTPGPVGLAAMRVARLLGVPMVGSFHTDLAAYTGILSGLRRLEKLMGAYMRWPYGRCARVLVPSEDTRRLLERGSGDADRVAVWRRGVDGAQFHPARRSSDSRQKWCVSRRCPAVLYVGRVSREKGLDLLPGLELRLRELGLAHRFIIVGSGPMLPELRRRMPEAVFTGALDRASVATAFASADVFVFPSRTDTAANVVLEAQASGLPVLVSDAGGPKENLVEGTSGFVVSGSSPLGWGAALVSLLSDESRRGEMAGAARGYAESRTWQAALEPLYRTYRELAARSSAAAAVPELLPRGISISMSEPATVAGVFAWIVCHPVHALFRRWNYKSALLSSLVRGTLFFAVNLRAGPEAATAAMLTEWAFRASTSGFYGALTQAFRCAQPQGLATLCAILLLPTISHGLELAVHWWRGTAELFASIVASVLLTVVSTAFNLFAMRRGGPVVGNGTRPILEDLRRMPELIRTFVALLARSCARVCR